jgi:serine/threonine-protein kinase RsbW
MSDGGLDLTVSARPENTAVVRHAIAGVGEALGMDEELIGDLKTIVTEACMNAVVHAYDGEPGLLEISAVPDSAGLTVVVRDFGRGIEPRPDLDAPSLKLGLPLIAALSGSFQIKGVAGKGTEVTMHMPLSLNGSGVAEMAPPSREESRGAELSIGDPRLMAPAISRVMSILAARSELSVDRVSDVMLITDALTDQLAGAFADNRVRMTVEDGDGTLDVRMGPMKLGEAERIRRELILPEIDASLEQLADRVEIEPGGEGEEYLYLRIAAAEPGPAP